MLIIRHRVNTLRELLDTPKKYGVEIDVRAYKNKLILNHEVFKEGEDLEDYLSHCSNRFIVFNIKEGGIERRVIELAKKSNVKDYFLLDCEFPFYYATRRDGVKDIAIRFSEAEPIEMALAQKGLLNWVWVDTNTELPLNKNSYEKLRDAGFKICLVCPERWGRPKDIAAYKKSMKEQGIKIDAVMTSSKYFTEWERE